MTTCIHRHDITDTTCGCSSPDLIHGGRVPLAFCQRCPYATPPAKDFFMATAQLLTTKQRTGEYRPQSKPCGGCAKKNISQTKNIEIKQMPVQELLPKHVTEWAVGINVAKRKIPTIERCIQSVLENGWEPVVFAEPDIKPIDGVEWVSRPNTIAAPVFNANQIGPQGQYGAHQNYIQTLADLLERFPKAQAIVYIQDDVIVGPDVKEFLEHDLWPVKKPGVVSPYCPSKSGYSMAGKSGVRPIKKGTWLVSAQFYIFPRVVAKAIVAHKLSKEWKGAFKEKEKTPWKRRCLDGFTGEILGRLNRQAYFYTPSLADHYEPPNTVRDNTTLGHGRHHGLRKAYNYQKISAFKRFPKPWVRWNNNGSNYAEQRFPPAPVISTDPLWVIMPGHNCSDLTIKCLNHLWHSLHPLHICYVDNGSDLSEYNTIVQALDRWENKTIIRNNENLQFTAANNQGLDAMRELRPNSHVLLLNNDCFVSQRCLDILRLHLEWHPNVASVGPVTNDRGMNSLRKKRNADEALCTDLSGTSDEIQSRLNKVRVEPRRMLPWFCTILHRDAVKILGEFPKDKSVASGLKVDDWWSEKMIKNGWQNLLCFDAFAAHGHSSTFKRTGQDRNALLKEANRSYRRL